MDQMQNIGEDLSDAIRTAGTLVDFHAGAWKGEVLDKNAAAIISEQTGSKPGSHRAYTSLLAGDDGLLKAVHTAQDRARNAYYRETLHFAFGRLLPNVKFSTFIMTMEGHKREVMARLDDFLDAWPALVKQAQVDLGQSAQGLFWPDVDQLRQRFYVRYDFYPVPAAGFKGLPDAIIEKLESNAETRLRQNLNAAMREGFGRIAKEIERVRERTDDADKVFRDTLVSGLKHVVDLMEPLNIMEDPDVTAIIEECREICSVHPQEIRNDLSVRTEVSERALKVKNLLEEAGF